MQYRVHRDAVPAGHVSTGLPLTLLRVALAAIVLSAVAAAALPAAASEGTSGAVRGSAAVGEPLFYPCTGCHPVPAAGGGKGLPNGFDGHNIVLAGHAALGEGSNACLVCHSDSAENPGVLKVGDGSTVSITGDVSKVCFRCHSAVYQEWKNGSHGAGRNKCTAAGCHNPHTPGFIFGSFLLPFVGNGFQAGVAAETATFTPLASPPVSAPTETPSWMPGLVVVGLIAAGGLTGSLIRGRSRNGS